MSSDVWIASRFFFHFLFLQAVDLCWFQADLGLHGLYMCLPQQETPREATRPRGPEGSYPPA